MIDQLIERIFEKMQQIKNQAKGKTTLVITRPRQIRILGDPTRSTYYFATTLTGTEVCVEQYEFLGNLEGKPLYYGIITNNNQQTQQ